jgi:hypothetical protein
VQKALTPHWSKVKAFALSSPWQFSTPGPDRMGNGFDPKDIDNLLALTSNLTDRQKVTAEFWADGPRSEFPPGHWALIAQVLSRKRGHSLDYDAKMFFALGNALLDASVAAWAFKYRWDYVRPITAIRSRYKGKQVTSWLGPYNGYGQVPGEQWIPYQSPNVVTPPFPSTCQATAPSARPPRPSWPSTPAATRSGPASPSRRAARCSSRGPTPRPARRPATSC